MNPKAILDMLLERGTVWSGLFFALGFLTSAILTFTENKIGLAHERFDDLRSNLFYFWCALALTAIVYQIQKNRKLNVRIAADQRLADPSVPNQSTVPEVQAQIDKIVRHSRDTGVSLIESFPTK